MQERLTKASLPSFFDGIVQQLHEEDVFQDYDEPKGPVIDSDRTVRYKMTHSVNNKKNTRGLRYHLGDQPFDSTVSGVAFRNVKIRSPMQPSQREILDKTRSIQEAIKYYVPQDKFTAYLRYFSENLHLPGHRRLLDNSFANMFEQLGVVVEKREEQRLDAAELEAFINAQTTDARLSKMGEMIKKQEPYYHQFPDGSPNRTTAMRAVSVVGRSKNLYSAPEFPELLLSLAIFQAAHMGYKEELSLAIRKAAYDDKPTLSINEYDNANAVVQESLRQFDVFLIFSGLLPLILHEHEKLSGASSEAAMTKDEQVREAITLGWKSFFKGQVLKSDTLSNAAQTSEDYEAERLTSVCPAKPHLRAMQGGGMIEAIYDGVTAHRPMLQDLIDTAGQYAEDVLTGRGNEKLENIIKSNDADYDERIKARLDQLGLQEDGTPYPRLGKSDHYVSKEEAKKLASALSKLQTALKEEGAKEPEDLDLAKEALEDYAAAKKFKQNGTIVKLTMKRWDKDKDYHISCFEFPYMQDAINEAFSAIPYDAELKEALLEAMPERARSELKLLSRAEKLQQERVSKESQVKGR